MDHRGLETDRDVADAGSLPVLLESRLIAIGVTRGLMEEVDRGVHGPDAPDGRARGNREVDAHQGQRDRDIDAVRDAVAHMRGELSHPRGDRVGRGDDVVPAGARDGIVVGEDDRNRAEVEAVDPVETEILVGEADGCPLLADGLGAVGDQRAEALGRPVEDPKGGVEGVGETGRGRGQRHRGQPRGEGGVEGREVRLERTVEVRRMGFAGRQTSLAVDDQTGGPEQGRNDEGQLLLRARRRWQGQGESQKQDAVTHSHGTS